MVVANCAIIPGIEFWRHTK